MPEAARRDQLDAETARARLNEQFDELHTQAEIVMPRATRDGQSFGLVPRHMALVRFGDISRPDSSEEFIHGSMFGATMSMPERGGMWKRAVEHRLHCIHGVVMIGGCNVVDWDDDGLWTVVGIEQRAKTAEGGSLQQAAINQTFLRSELPDGMKAIPEGLFKDVQAPAHRTFSIWNDHYLFRTGNLRLLHALQATYSLAKERLNQGTLMHDTQLVPPKFWVAPTDGECLRLRWRDTEEPMAGLGALDLIDAQVAMRIQRGDWDVPAYSANRLVAGTEGTVTKVEDMAVTIRTLAGGETRIVMQVNAFREYVRNVTGFDASDLPVMPIVEVGRLVGRSTCLFGPALPGDASTAGLRRSIDEADVEQRRARTRDLHLLRLWAIVASGRAHGNQTLYPISLVAAANRRQVYAQVAGTENGQPWDVRLQRIIMEVHPSKCLKTAGAGFVVDLFTTSHRQQVMDYLARRRQGVMAPKAEDRQSEPVQESSESDKKTAKKTAKAAKKTAKK